MSSVFKEMLLDYGMDRLTLEEKADIDSAIAQLIQRGVISKRHKQLLLAYTYGYTADEIAAMSNIPVPNIEIILTFIIYTLAEELQIKDDEFIDRIKDTVPQSKLPKFKQFLSEHYLQYDTHTVRKG